MASAKYKEYFQKMMTENQELFAKFAAIHEQYKLNPQVNQQKFNDVGHEIVELMRDWERRLCTVMGKGQYSQYAEKLSEKFWNLARKEYDQIDMVGVKIEMVKAES